MILILFLLTIINVILVGVMIFMYLEGIMSGYLLSGILLLDAFILLGVSL